jgi:hypothetical protein
MVCPGRGVSYVCLRNRCLDTGVLDVVTHASESVSPPVVGMRFGYIRVSTVAQTLYQQHDALPLRTRGDWLAEHNLDPRGSGVRNGAARPAR